MKNTPRLHLLLELFDNNKDDNNNDNKNDYKFIHLSFTYLFTFNFITRFTAHVTIFSSFGFISQTKRAWAFGLSHICTPFESFCRD